MTIIQNFRPGVMAKYGYDDFKKIKPQNYLLCSHEESGPW